MFNTVIKNIHITVMFILLGLSGISTAADLAGKVVFVRGTPTAVDAANTVRPLVKGSEVFAGDRLVSGNGKIQVSMIDGAFVSVQPESEFTIEGYTYAGTADGTESATMRLVKGGVRAVTGAIGKDNPEAYKLHTSVATIGIRGTGYNTRICAGDCPGRTDGLYHNTWEGITYVANNVESRDVPSRNGVFVKDINAPIEILAQVAGVTAIDEGVAIAEESRKEEDTNTVIASGEQRTDDGLRVAVSGNATGSARVLTGLVGIHINPNDEDGGVDVGGLENMSIFFDADGKPVGALFSEDDDITNSSNRGLATIDLNAVLAGDNPAAITEIRSLVAANNPVQIANAQQNPARVADFTMVDNFGWFRWTGGDVLVVNDKGDTDTGLSMTGNQSVHIITGPAFDSAPITTGFGFYNFIGGTQSTSVSGKTIGAGVTSGAIFVDFSSAEAGLSMTVNHINEYSVFGLLDIDNTGAMGLKNNEVLATILSPVVGSVCYPYCEAYIEGGFPGLVTDGIPDYAGIAYSINESDEIIGVAGFKNTPTDSSVSIPIPAIPSIPAIPTFPFTTIVD